MKPLPLTKKKKKINHWPSNPWKWGSILLLVRAVLFHCEPAVTKVEVYLQGGHVKKWPFCLEGRMERRWWYCQGHRQITKAIVSEMAICDFREVPVEADRVFSKTQCGNYLLKRPLANTGLPGSNGPHPTVCATKVWSKFCFQLCLQGDEVLLMGKGVDIYPSWIYFSLSVLCFST